MSSHTNTSERYGPTKRELQEELDHRTDREWVGLNELHERIAALEAENRRLREALAKAKETVAYYACSCVGSCYFAAADCDSRIAQQTISLIDAALADAQDAEKEG